MGMTYPNKPGIATAGGKPNKTGAAGAKFGLNTTCREAPWAFRTINGFALMVVVAVIWSHTSQHTFDAFADGLLGAAWAIAAFIWDLVVGILVAIAHAVGGLLP